ncbi:MAG: hypothetical protein R2728_07785 [Chitinophagales bacterium]
MDEFRSSTVDLIPNPAKNSTILRSGIEIPKNSILQIISVDGKIAKQLELDDSQKQVRNQFKESIKWRLYGYCFT